MVTGIFSSFDLLSVAIDINGHRPPSESRVDEITQLRTDDVHCRVSAGTGSVVLDEIRDE